MSSVTPRKLFPEPRSQLADTYLVSGWIEGTANRQVRFFLTWKEHIGWMLWQFLGLRRGQATARFQSNTTGRVEQRQHEGKRKIPIRRIGFGQHGSG